LNNKKEKENEVRKMTKKKKKKKSRIEHTYIRAERWKKAEKETH
jgi:hypothetical protein